MNRRTALLLHAATFLLTATGLIYAAMHYLMEPVDPFAVVNHPLEPYMLQAHLVLAPALVFLIGMILHSHVLLKLGNGASASRRSGILLAWLFGVMVLSGYLLQVFTSTGHRPLFWVHLASGTLWALGYAAHQISSARVKRMMEARSTRAVLALALMVIGLLAAKRLFAQDTAPLEREVRAMGTTLRIVACCGDSDALLRNSEQVLRVVEATEAQLSTWRDGSELSRLNRQPPLRPFPLTPSLCDVLSRVRVQVQSTEGAFDPSMGRLGEIWAIHRGFRIPGDAEVAEALRATGFQKIRVDEHACTATRLADVLLDPGAFGKGEALDRALRVARFPMMLDLGGQVAVIPMGAARSWEVTLADPIDRSLDSNVRVRLMSGSLSTSGGSERDGSVNRRRISHILDPRTGRPARSFGSVTVWSNTAFEADALSTALYVMGPERGLKWAAGNGVAACYLIVTKRGIEVRKSPAFVDKLN